MFSQQQRNFDTPLPIHALQLTKEEQEELERFRRRPAKKNWLLPVAIVVAVALLALIVKGFSPNKNKSVSPSLSAFEGQPVASDYDSSNMPDGGKTEWPELVGKPGEEAKKQIEKDNPSLTTVQIIPDGSMVTMDYRTDRVRIFVKEDGTVARAPQAG